jgi:sugar phosphate isomerase/epimerase
VARKTLEPGTKGRATALPDIGVGSRRSPEAPDALRGRLGLNVPDGWWPSAPLLKAFEAAGFGWTQVHSPPPPVLATPRLCTAHAATLAATLDTTGLRTVVHGPNSLLAGSEPADRAFEGLLSWAAEIGAEQVVYHARALPDGPTSESALLFETRSLARLASRAERLGVTIAIENLAPVFPGVELLSANPMALRGLAHRIGSERVGICLDLGHAHIVADLRHTTVDRLIEPVLDVVSVFHVHDNLGGRLAGTPSHRATAGIDPLRLDLHLPPGRGNLPWDRIAPLLAGHDAPLVMELHPPYRPRTADAYRAAAQRLA